MSSNRVIDAINSAESFDKPYSHFYMTNIFGVEEYQDILSALPPNDAYEQFMHPDAKVSEYESTRLRLPLKGDNLNKVGESIKNLVKVAQSQEFRETVFNKLKKDLTKRFGPNLDKIDCSAHCFLFRDLQGYKIAPHPDAATKVVTFQMYLPKDDDHATVGTIVYDGNHERVKQFPFVKSSGYGFAVSDYSWHGVEKVDTADGFIRDSFMVIFYMNTKEYK